MTSCNSDLNSAMQLKLRNQHRKLIVLGYIRDSLERKLAAIDASISTLNKQIDNNKDKLENELGNS